jgi:hypothetical protein
MDSSITAGITTAVASGNRDLDRARSAAPG